MSDDVCFSEAAAMRPKVEDEPQVLHIDASKVNYGSFLLKSKFNIVLNLKTPTVNRLNIEIIGTKMIMLTQ